jgi:signal transduction histidine kinase
MKRSIAQGQTSIESYIEAAQEGVDKAAGLTRRLLAFARKQPLLPQPVEPGQLIEGMLALIRRSVGERIAIDTRLRASWLIHCDPNQMENVILNLANNARDAMPDGGTLVISTRDRTVRSRHDLAQYELASGDYVELVVRDNGTGMTEEVRKRVLEPFFTTKVGGKGTGLGLSTAFGYIRQSGGYLAVDSRPGNGTAITILMPRYVAQPAAVALHATKDAA